MKGGAQMVAEILKEKTENQYREKVKKVFEKYQKVGDEIVWYGPEEVPQPTNGDWWGSWRYDAKSLVIAYYDEKGKLMYEVDLKRCNSSAQVLDWICQLDKKNWCGAECVGQLVQAIDDLIDPQANICGLGKDTAFDATKYLREKQKESERKKR
jgi:hypothetical protein